MLMNEQQPVENKKVNKDNTWKPVVIGGVSGIVLGGVATTAMAATANHLAEDAADETTLGGVHGSATVDGSVPVAQVSDDMSFSEAFAAAHEQVGPGGVFVWHGQVYSTFTEEEWNNMTPAEHAEFGSHVHVQYDEPTHTSSQSTTQATPAAEVVAEPATAEHQPEVVAHVEQTNDTPSGEQQNIEVEVQVTGESGDVVVNDVTDNGLCVDPEDPGMPATEVAQEPQVEVLEYTTLTNEDGSQMDLAVVSVDGQAMGVYDVNQDGVADLVAVDANENHQIEENEIHDISADGLSMQALQDDYLAQNDPSMQGPDYINDGDVENYMA